MSGRVVVAGAASWNTMIRVDAFPEPGPGTIFPPGWHEAVGSSGAGKALNLARLGVPVTLHCLLGGDEAGRRVRATLESAGVVVDAIPDATGTARHVNLMDPAGRRLSFLLQTGDPELPIDIDRLTALIEDADQVLVELTDRARPALAIARRLGRPTWADLHATDGERAWERDFWTADHVVFSGERLADPRPFMDRLRGLGARLVVCTLGAAGALALAGDGRWLEVPAEPVETVVDTNGAGDAFVAGTLAGLRAGDPLEAALRRGSRQAARAIQSTDLAPPA